MQAKVEAESWTGRAFRALDTECRGHLYKDEMLDLIQAEGVYSHHNLSQLIKILEAKDAKEPISYKEFEDLTNGLIFLKRVYEYGLMIPQYEAFHNNFKQSFKEIKADVNNEFAWGEVATYIPPLARADPSWFATSFCSADG